MSRRRVLATLGVTAVAATAVIAAPTGDTQARWTETRTSVVPRMTMGTPTLTPTDVPVTKPFTDALKATLKNDAGYGLEYRPYQVNLTAMPSTPTTSAMASDFLNNRVQYDYTGCSSTTALWQTALGTAATTAVSPVTAAVRTPLAKASSTSHCVIVKPSGTDYDRYNRFAGREFQVTTTGRAVSVAGTATKDWTWTSRYVISIPSPMLGSDGNVCTTGLAENVRLYWAWPNAATSSSGSTPAINRWEVWARPKGSTVPFKLVQGGIPANDRDQWVSYIAMNNAGYGPGTYEFVVRVYPFAGSTKYAESTVMWYATRPTGPWEPTLDTGIFHAGQRLVPGRTVGGALYVKNASPDTAMLTIGAVPGSDAVSDPLAEVLHLAAGIGGAATPTETSPTAASLAARGGDLTTGAVRPGQVVRVEVAALLAGAVGDVDRTLAENHTWTDPIRVSMAMTPADLAPPSTDVTGADVGQTGGSDGSVPRGDAFGVSSGPLSGALAHTGADVIVLLAAGGTAVGVGMLLIALARRRRKDEDDTASGTPLPPTGQIPTP